MKSISSHAQYCLFCQGLLADDVGVARGTTVFREIRPWAGFETGDFVEESLGGGCRRTTPPTKQSHGAEITCLAVTTMESMMHLIPSYEPNAVCS